VPALRFAGVVEEAPAVRRSHVTPPLSRRPAPEGALRAGDGSLDAAASGTLTDLLDSLIRTVVIESLEDEVGEWFAAHPEDRAVAELARSHERTWEQTIEETGTKGTPNCWPAGACVESTIALVDEAAAKIPAARLTFVWGRFVNGRTASGVPVTAHWGHAWAVTAAGLYVDLTAGQFLNDRPYSLLFTLPRHHSQHYLEESRQEYSPPGPAIYA
jgi:hypothetical protein